MIVVDFNGKALPDYAVTLDTKIRLIAMEFARNEWKWHNETPTLHEIEMRVCDAIVSMAREAEIRHHDYAAVTFGRIRVEIREMGGLPTAYNVTLGIQYVI